MPQSKDITALITSLQTRELDDLETKRDTLLYDTYPGLAEALTKTAAETGLSELVILRTCARMAATLEDYPWHRILAVVRSFHITAKAIEQELRGKE
jgi:hypothetical protein